MKLKGLLALATTLLFALLYAATPRGPEDWDGIGFLLSVSRFDLSDFRPHAPGYPVYCALLRIANLAATDPLVSTRMVGSLSVAGAIAFGTLAIRRRWGLAQAAWTFAFAAVAPIVVRAATSIGSEAPALLLLALSAFVAGSPSGLASFLAGMAGGLGLGVRLSWAPIFFALPLVLSRRRHQALAGLGVGLIMWGIPFLAVVRPGPLWQILHNHAVGHFTRWGGGAMTRPGFVRFVWLLRDVCEDGLGWSLHDPLGMGTLVASFGLFVAATPTLRPRRAGARTWLGLALPYAVWVLLAQNLAEQPRHALPLVALAVIALALAAASGAWAGRIGAVVVVGMALVSAKDVRDRWRSPAPGAQIVAWAETEQAPSALFFGGPSARFFQLSALAANARSVGSLGEVRLALTRLNALPEHVFVTSELVTDELPDTLVNKGEFCRPPRLDRRAPCVTVYEWPAPYRETRRTVHPSRALNVNSPMRTP